ncbi:MAG: SGNH/GDSL hydrolase family protein [Deltaproteobacteria bacterium]|nr:SGNH/GDSL hydrolase family protein [Deltaproteobacteria bacterium]
MEMPETLRDSLLFSGARQDDLHPTMTVAAGGWQLMRQSACASIGRGIWRSGLKAIGGMTYNEVGAGAGDRQGVEGAATMERELADLGKRLEAGERLVVAGLGDSLTAGWLVRRGFFERFCDGLQARFPRARIERVLAGVPGDTAADGLARVGGVLRARPQLVVVQFGLNDCFCGVHPHEFQQTVDALVERLQGAGAAVILATSVPLAEPRAQDVVSRIYAALGEVGRRRHVPVARLDLFWLSHVQAAPHAARGLFQADGVHPTDEGHQLLAEGLLGLLAAPEERTGDQQ